MQICKYPSLGSLFPCLLLFLQMWVEQILEIGGEANIWLFVPQPQSCGEPSTMDRLFANHLNKDYPRISPRDGRNTSSHFVKIAILQGRGMGLKPAKSQPPYKT